MLHIVELISMSAYNPPRLVSKAYDRPVDILATRPHFVDHIAPVWRHLENRGGFYVPEVLLDYAKTKVPEAVGVKPVGRSDKLNIRPPEKNVYFTCAYGDLEKGMITDLKRVFIFMEHGVGLVFPGNPHYAGSVGLRRRVHFFLAPNQNIHDKTWTTFPEAPQAIVGTPKMDNVPTDMPINRDDPLIIISFHWDGRKVAREAANAYPHFREILPEIAKRYHLAGHAHPRIANYFERVYNELGIEFIRDFDEVMRRGDLYLNDASSTAYEFGVTGKPVILLNSPGYRRNINFGIRFWQYTDWAIQVDEPGQLISAIEQTLHKPSHEQKQKQMVADLYPYHGQSAKRAADQINRFLNMRGTNAIQDT